jgi:hypothetical protein
MVEHRIDPLWLFQFRALAWYCQREYRRLRPMDQRRLFS